MADKAEVANLEVLISANTKALTEGINRLGLAMDQMTATTKKGVEQSGAAFDKLGKAASTAAGLIQGALAGFTAASVVAEIRKAQQAYVELGLTAKKLELDPARLGAIVNIAGQGGVKNGLSDLSTLGAKANTEFRDQEGELTKLLEANNLKITDRQGRLKDVNALLEDAARLVQNAKTEFDKIDIARIFGLSEDWVRTLEKGPDALRKSIDAAEDAGGAIDREMVQKAEAFDKAWSSAMESFANYSKSAIYEIGSALGGLVKAAAGVSTAIAMASKAAGAAAAGKNFVPQDIETMKSLREELAGLEKQRDDIIAKSKNPDARDMLIAPLASQIANLKNRIAMTPENAPESVNTGVPNPVARPEFILPDGTKLPGKVSGGSRGRGGGGGGGLDEEDKAENRLNQYLKSLERAHAVEQARLETFGKSNAAQKAAMELARAMPDLNRVDAETKQKLTDAITAQIEKIEAAREAHEKLRLAQEGVRDAAKGMADMMAGAIEDLVLNGTKAQDVLKNLTKTLASSGIKALLTGEGPLAGLLGTKGVNGAPGGILGGLFSGLLKGFGGAAAGSPLSLIPKFATGTDYVSRTGLAQIHKGEMIIPASDAARMRGGGGGGGGRNIVINQTIQANGDATVARIAMQATRAGLAAYDNGLLSNLAGKQARYA